MRSDFSFKTSKLSFHSRQKEFLFHLEKLTPALINKNHEFESWKPE